MGGDTGEQGEGPNLEKPGGGGLPVGGGARIEFCRLGRISLLEASSLSRSSRYDSSLLTDMPVAAFYRYMDDIYLCSFGEICELYKDVTSGFSSDRR